jgi:hypothetical protein
MYYVNKIEIYLLKIIGIQPCTHSHKKFTQNPKKMLHEKIWVLLPHAPPWYKNAQVPKKTNQSDE